MSNHTPARKIRVNARKFAAAWNFISTEETRYYLNGVCITPCREGGVLLIATNGHYMGIVHDETGETDAEYICPVPKKIITAIRRRPSRGDHLPSRGDHLARPGDLHFVGNAAFLTCEGFDGEDLSIISDAHIEVAYAPAIDATFPDYSRVIPPPFDGKEKGITEFAINGNFPPIFSDAVRLLTSEKSPSLCFGVRGRGEPLTVTSPAAESFFGLLMPMLGDSSQRPTWVPEFKKSEKAKP